MHDDFIYKQRVVTCRTAAAADPILFKGRIRIRNEYVPVVLDSRNIDSNTHTFLLNDQAFAI
jgi:hypothetical protein